MMEILWRPKDDGATQQDINIIHHWKIFHSRCNLNYQMLPATDICTHYCNYFCPFQTKGISNCNEGAPVISRSLTLIQTRIIIKYPSWLTKAIWREYLTEKINTLYWTFVKIQHVKVGWPVYKRHRLSKQHNSCPHTELG